MSAPSRQSGFTLIEILLVIFIIGILVGLSFVSFGPASIQRQGGAEGDRLESLLLYLGDQSLLEGGSYSLLFSPTGYQALVLNDEKRQWEPCDYAEIHQLPEGLRLKISLDESALKDVGAVLNQGPWAAGTESRAWIFPDGELSSFSLALYEEASKVVVFSLASDGLNIHSSARRGE